MLSAEKRQYYNHGHLPIQNQNQSHAAGHTGSLKQQRQYSNTVSTTIPTSSSTNNHGKDKESKNRAKPSMRRTSISRKCRRNSTNAPSSAALSVDKKSGSAAGSANLNSSKPSPINAHIVSKRTITIESDSLIALCSPFTIPEQTNEVCYVVNEKRYRFEDKTDLALIYGALDSTITTATTTTTKALTATNNICINKSLQALNKQKHLAFLSNTIDILANRPVSATESILDTEFLEMIDPISDAGEEDEDEDNATDLDSIYDSSLDLDKDRIPETIISSLTNGANTLLAPIPEKPYANVFSILNSQENKIEVANASTSANCTASFFFD